MATENPKIPRFAGGMDMLSPDYAIPQGYIRDAANLDVTAEGVLRTREGHATVPRVEGSRCHSLFATPAFMLHADGATLKRTTAGGTSTVADVQYGQPVAYATLPDGSVVFSDGATIGKVGASGSAVRLALPAPGSPALAPAANGLLKAGRYLVAVTWVSLSGEESSPSLPVAVGVADGQGISISGIPPSGPSGALALRIYCSHTNESALFEAAFIAAGVTSARIDAAPGGPFLETLFEAPFPACSVLAFAAGRLLGFRGSVLYWSEPFRHGVFRPASNFLQFAHPGAVIVPTQDGVYVGTLGPNGEGEVGFLSGFDFGSQPYRMVTPYGAYPGTLAALPNSTQAVWASPRGFVVVDASGQVSNISQERVVFPGATRGGSLVREKNGVRQIISSLVPTGANTPFVSTGYAEGEVIKGASTQ